MTARGNLGYILTAADLEVLAAKINAILPPQYQNCYDRVPPTSMGSAALKIGADGMVAWDEIWTSFCDLALAGGPAHRGTLLEPADEDEVAAHPQQYHTAAQEIARGIHLATQLLVLPAFAPGWVGVRCDDAATAQWLMQAITVENVSARRQGDILLVPAGPAFRLEKEIKNVVTAVAKTHHYCAYHMRTTLPQPAGTHIEPALKKEIRKAAKDYARVVHMMRNMIQQEIGLPTVAGRCMGWIGVRCRSVEMAIWLLRAIVVNQVLARREQQLLCLPAGPGFASDGSADRVVTALVRAYRLWELNNGYPHSVSL